MFLRSSKQSTVCLRFKDSRSSTLDGDPYILLDNGTLEIRIAQTRHSGKYTCAARNILGIYENHVSLEVKGEFSFSQWWAWECTQHWTAGYIAMWVQLCFDLCFDDLRCQVFTVPLPSEPTRILRQPEYKVVQRGGSVVFECKVTHDKSLTPIMTWLKDDGELPDDERSERFF